MKRRGRACLYLKRTLILSSKMSVIGDKGGKLMKKMNGITLIALVITIVVLIILAGVAINLSIGENGIFKRAEEAKQETLIAQYKEKIELVKAETGVKNEGNITLDKLNIAFSESIQKDWVNKTEIKDGTIRLTTNDGYLFFITESITEYKGTGDVIIPDIITAEMVEFTPTDTTWKTKDGTDITNIKQALDYLYNN